MDDELLEDIGELEVLEEIEDSSEITPIKQNKSTPKPELTTLPVFEKFKALYSFSTIPILITDSNFTIAYANPKIMQDILHDLDVVGKSFFNIVDAKDLQLSITEILDSLRSGSTGFSWIGGVTIRHFEFLNVSSNTIFTPIFKDKIQPDQIPAGYLCIFDDITKVTKDILSRTYLSLLEASKLKDNDTGNHIRRVGEYSRIISKNLFNKQILPEVDRQFIENIAFLAPMHDVGKIGTPDNILHKPGPLNDTEWSIMKEHTINGGFIMGGYPDKMAKQIPLSHHERWDGAGYPYQLSEDMIPLAARISSLADVYDALRMKRSYKDPISHKETCEIITKDSGKQFDPTLIKVFLELESKFDNVFNLLSD